MTRSLTRLLLPGLAALSMAATPALAGKVAVDAGVADDVFDARRVALMIGIDSYADPALERLAFAGKDARDVAATLKNPHVGDYDEVHVLTGAQATSRAAILAKLQQVTANLQRDDTFLLYLSGHGTLTLDPIEGTRLWFLPSDATLATPADGGIEVAWLEKTLTELVPRRRVLIMDTCHNGRSDGSRAALNATTRDRLASLRGDPPAPNAVAEVTESEARLFAAQYYQPAMEDKSLQNGVYTHYLLQALQSDRGTADLDRDGLVDVTEAHDYAQDRTIRHTGGLQVPRAEYRIVGREAIFLSGDPSRRTKSENALVSAYNGLYASARLLVDGQSRGSLPSVHAITPGKHHIEIQTTDGRTIYAEKLTLKAGEHLQVEELVKPEPSVWTVQAGAIVTQGSPSLPLAAPEVELGWRPGVRGRWQPGLNLRAMVGASTRDLELASNQGGVMPTIGGFIGYRVHDRFAVGPELDAGVLTRSYLAGEGARYSDVAPALLPGLRAEWRVPAGRAGDAMVRYDVRVLPLPGSDGWTASAVHGLSVGAAFR